MLDLTMHAELLNKTHGAENVSKRYKAISTQRVIDHFMAKGFTPETISIARANKIENQGFQKHIVCFDAPDNFPVTLDGLIPKLYLLNSHNAKTSLQIFFGVYRMVCSNGLVVGTDFFRERIIHTGDVETNIRVALENSEKSLVKLGDVINRWQNFTLSAAQQQNLAERLWLTRLPMGHENGETETKYSIPEGQLKSSLRISRLADASNDLFTVFNRLQERLVERPNVRYLKIETGKKWGDTVRQLKKLRKLSPIAKITANRALWAAAEQFYISEVA